jgi:fumarate reductase flavoprotein subunit
MISIKKSQVSSTEDLKYDTDIVIAGGGLSGLSAALTAAESGVKAIVLEKLHFLGGAGIFPEGSLGIGTRYQKKNEIQTTAAEVFAKVMEFHHWRCNASVIRTLLNESGKTIDWFQSSGSDQDNMLKLSRIKFKFTLR